MGERNEIIENYTSNKPFSFGGIKYVLKGYPNLDKKYIEHKLSESDPYTKFRSYKKPKTFPAIRVYEPWELFEIDLAFFTDKLLVNQNEGYQYTINIIDCFTKYAWVIPIKNKLTSTICIEVEELFNRLRNLPKKIRTDMGGEFNSKQFKSLIKKMNIQLYFSLLKRKCAFIERFNLTIKQLLYKILFHNSSLKWTFFLPQAMRIYLSRDHRTTKMSPNQAVLPKNKHKLLEVYLQKYNKDSHGTLKKNKVKPKFKIGDNVRLKNEKNTFSRGFKSGVTTEFYQIYAIDRNLSRDRYYIEDKNLENITGKREIIQGSFDSSELVLYTPGQSYRLDPEHKIIYRGKGKNREAYVKFQDWDKKYNLWIPATDLKNI